MSLKGRFHHFRHQFPVCTMEVSGLRGLLWQGCVLPRSGNQASAQGDGPARSPCFHRNSRWPYRLLFSSQPLLPFAEAPSRDAEDDGLSQHRQTTHSEDARKANLQCHGQWNPSAQGAHNSLEGQHAAQGTQRALLMKTQETKSHPSKDVASLDNPQIEEHAGSMSQI